MPSDYCSINIIYLPPPFNYFQILAFPDVPKNFAVSQFKQEDEPSCEAESFMAPLEGNAVDDGLGTGK